MMEEVLKELKEIKETLQSIASTLERKEISFTVEVNHGQDIASLFNCLASSSLQQSADSQVQQ